MTIEQLQKRHATLVKQRRTISRKVHALQEKWSDITELIHLNLLKINEKRKK